MTFIGGRSFADALVDEDEVGVLFGEFRHRSLASIDVFFTYADGCTTISFVVEVIIILVSNVFTNLIEESVEVEELREVFFCYLATELSKAQEVGVCVSEIDGIIAEFGKQIFEEIGFVSQFHVVQPQLPVHTCAISQIHVKP